MDEPQQPLEGAPPPEAPATPPPPERPILLETRALSKSYPVPGRQAGEFIRAHMVAIDSKSRMYTGEAGNGRRMQRWILKGTKPASSVKPPVPTGEER